LRIKKNEIKIVQHKKDLKTKTKKMGKTKMITRERTFKKLGIFVLSITLVLFSQLADAGKNYYFSSISGDDTRTSTQAQNSATPWKTISKLNSFFNSLNPGDSVLFKRNESFYGSIIVSKSGSASLPIVIGAYGSGNKPVITGFVTLTGWTNEGNGIYSKAVTCESKPDLVTINGVLYGMGRYPNSGSNWLTVDSHVTNVSITDADLNSATTNWAGAEAVITKDDYTLDRCLITNHTNQTLTYTSLASSSNATDNYFYFLQNDLRTLDQFGEWYYNGTKLYMYFGSEIPSNYTVKVSTINKVVLNPYLDYITVVNLNCEGANVVGISFETSADYCNILNCDVNYSGNDGIVLVGTHGLIDNSNVANVNESGITVNGSFLTVTNNKVKKCGVIPGACAWGSRCLGLVPIGNDNLCQYNSIDSVGYHGLYLAGSRSVVKNNLISNFCLTLNDGGGIYTDGNDATARVIDGNIVLNGIGKLGLSVGTLMVDGIYLDQFSNDVEVKNNSVAYCAYSGIKLHRAHSAVIRNNTCFSNRAGIRMQESNTANPIYDLTVKNNVFVANSGQYTLMWNRITSSDFGVADSNYYARPIDDNATIRTTDLTNGDVNRTLANWQQYSQEDFHSNKSPLSITSASDIRFEYNATKTNLTKTLPGTYMDVKGTLYVNSITLAPYTSAVLIKSASNNNQSPVIQNQNFAVTENSSNGSIIGTVVASDPDAGQTLTYSILSGNTSSAFSINSSTGVLSVANSTALSMQTNPSFSLIVKVQDNGPGTLSSQATVSITLTSSVGCSATGNISYQVWNGVAGSTVASLTSNTNYPNTPSSTVTLTSMEAPSYYADNFGARIAGYICAPSSGSYTFWIASDDNAELWLSTNNQSANKQKIAYNTASTGSREWNKFATQKSASINLVQGQSYYIEALMKEDIGPDNLAVGWLKPGQTGTVPSEVIPGSVLSPLGTPQTVLVTSVSLPSTTSLIIGSNVSLTATVLPANANNSVLTWTSSNTSVATVNSSGLVTGLSTGSVDITATSTDGSNKSGKCTVTVNASPCSAVGNISYQVWNNISGSAVSALTSSANYPNNPSTTAVLTSMEAATSYTESYGARIAGYICAPITGIYTFWIASDDNAELWLSTDNQVTNKQKIAYNTSWTNSREWNKYSTQKSASINLVQGQSYYIEALMKQDIGPANIAVGWLKPGQTGTVPSEVVPGTYLSPLGTTQTILVSSVSLPSTTSLTVGSSVTLTPNVLPANATNSTLNWTSSNSSIATVNSLGLVNGLSAGTASITATSVDGSNKSGTCVITVNQSSCSATGNITYQVWSNVSGTAVSSLTSNANYPGSPTTTSSLTSMEAAINYTESYGARIAGYICAPSSGSYTFWIASDDNSELWLSTNDQSANKQKIAYHTSWTNSREWNKYSTQKSATINLIQGQSYYIEALMKQDIGPANLAVGWLKPGETGTAPSEVIPGTVLSPITAQQTVLVSSVSLPTTASVNAGSGVAITSTVLPSNATNSTLSWSSSNTSVATVNSSGLVTGINSGTATITATSTDGSNKSGSCVVTVNSLPCTAVGNVTYQVWNSVSGTTVSALTSNANYPNNPSTTTLLTSMEAALNYVPSYGARIAGYICAPLTGSYTFWIASDDNAELWLSTNDQASNKQKIAYHTSWTNLREWNKFTTQKSVTINLVQGQSYYIEALMKQDMGPANFSIGWLKPGQTGNEPSEIIPGTVLSPLGSKSSEAKIENSAFSDQDFELVVYPNPLSGEELSIRLENSTSEATLAIYSISGVECFRSQIMSADKLFLDRTKFRSGIYIIKVFNDHFVKTSRLIIK